MTRMIAALLLSVLALGAFWVLVYDASVLIALVVVLQAIALLALAFGYVHLRSR